MRLGDIRPDGAVTRVTYGLLNLTHRYGHEAVTPWQTDREETVTVPLSGIAQRLPAGHRLRLAISTSYWPLAWPAPDPVTMWTRPDSIRLHLPERSPDPADELLRPFPEPAGARPPDVDRYRSDRANWSVHHDLGNALSELDVIRGDQGWYDPAIDLDIRHRTRERYRIIEGDPTTARGETRTHRVLRRGGWSVSITTRTILSCDRDCFHLHAELDAYEDERRQFADTWNRRIPRDLV